MKATTVAMALVVAGASLTLWAAQAPQAATAPTTQPADPEAAAEALIEQLLEEQAPGRPVLAPAQPQTRPVDDFEAALPGQAIEELPPPAGGLVVDRVGRLVIDGTSEWGRFHFESERGVLREPPLRLLPNRLLEAMERLSDQGRRPGTKFRVSGEVTEYRGQRYLLLRKLIVERDFGAL